MLNLSTSGLQEPPPVSGKGPQDATGRLRPLDAFSGSLAQRVYASLREAILSIAFRPGEVLRKSEICATLGVSRSPVAEAVARLQAEALVDVVPQAGTFVARFSLEEIREGAFLREALELHAVEQVARTVTPGQIADLRRNLRFQEVLVTEGDSAGFYRLDAEMHEMILSFTGHRRLPGLARTAWVHVDRARQIVLPQPGRVAATLQEHAAIIDAIAAGDPTAARAATAAHLGQLVTRIERLAADAPDIFAS